MPRVWWFLTGEPRADNKPEEEAETKTLLVALLVPAVVSKSGCMPGKSQQDSWLSCMGLEPRACS